MSDFMMQFIPGGESEPTTYDRLLAERQRRKAPKEDELRPIGRSVQTNPIGAERVDNPPTQQQAYSYEQLMSKARELKDAGDIESARRVARIALKQRGNEPQKSFGQLLKENLFGDDDPNSHNFGEKVGQALNTAGESLSFGLVGDEADALVNSTLRGTSYDEELEAARQRQEVFERDNPGVAFASTLAPALIPGLGAGAALRGAGAAKRAVTGAGVSGAQGATYGFAEGEGGFDERMTRAKQDGAISATLGAAAGPASRGLEMLADGRAQKAADKALLKSAPSADDLFADASALYGRAEARGEVFTPDNAKQLSTSIKDALVKAGVMRSTGSLITRDPDVKRVIDELSDLEQYGLSGNQVKPVREVFSAAAKDSNPTRARIGKIILDQYDLAITKVAPEFLEGDELYTRGKKVQAVERITDVADATDNTNALRNEFSKLDKTNARGKQTSLGNMSPDELGGMHKAARGSTGERIARGIGRSAPRSITSAMFTGSTPFIAGSLAGSPAMGAAVGAGALGLGLAGKAIANRSQAKNADLVRAIMATPAFAGVQVRDADTIVVGGSKSEIRLLSLAKKYFGFVCDFIE